MAVQDVTKPMALDETLQTTNTDLEAIETAIEGIGTSIGDVATDTTLQAINTALGLIKTAVEGVGLASVGNLSQLTTTDKTSLVAAVNEIDSDKVDKEIGKGLSENDFTDALKDKLDGIPGDATAVEGSEINGNIIIDDVETPVYRNYGNNTVLQTDKTPFLTRQTLNPTGFSGYVREKLVGASYAWNQLIDGATLPTISGTTLSNGIYTVTTSPSSESITNIVKIDIIKDHVYYLNPWLNFYDATLIGPSGIANKIFKALGTGTPYAERVLIPANTPVGTKLAPNCIDLTLAFGSTIADYLYGLSNNGGITKLREMGFPIDKYTPYGYGLYSVKTSGKKISGYGKNLFDKDSVELGAINQTTGADEDSTTIYRTKGFIYVKPNTSYYISGIGSNSIRIFTYSDSGYISTAVYSSGNFAITMGSNITKVRFHASSFNSFKDTMQMELGSQATEYEEYKTLTYSLGNDELRGKFGVVNGEIVASGDVKESNGEITRPYKEVKMSTLAFVKDGRFFLCAMPSDSSDVVVGGLKGLCSKYECWNSNSPSMPDKSFTINNAYFSNSKGIYVLDSAYSDATTFNAAIANEKLLYPLATPTTEISTPFADPMSMIGATTEEYIDEREIPCPVGAERQYMGQSENVVEIPSSPLADGKRVLTSYVSGGKEQLVWEGVNESPSPTPSQHNYSTSEQVIGTWIDGKPLYEKVIEFGALPNATSKSVNHNIANVDKIWVVTGYARNSTTGACGFLEHTSISSLTYTWGVSVDKTSVNIATGMDRSSFDDTVVIVNYTKTTDLGN